MYISDFWVVGNMARSSEAVVVNVLFKGVMYRE
jgi:hypothetical protein